MNKTLDNMVEHRKIAKQIGLKPMFSKEELTEERNITSAMKGWF